MKNILPCLFIFFINNLYANNYYFSSGTGDDSRSFLQAQKPATPWKTIAKLNAYFSKLHAGDTLFFKRGDVFEGSINITLSGSKNNPVVLTSYGKGRKAVISGFISLKAWTDKGNKIFDIADQRFLGSVNMFTINNVPQRLGRYPNADAVNGGYLIYETSVSNKQIKDNELSSNPDWTYGEVVIRKNRWVVDRNFITKHSGNTIQYKSGSHYSADPGFGYFIQNHPKALDRQGEWYFDATSKKIGVYLQGNPRQDNFRASAIHNLVAINNHSDIVIDNLIFEGANNNAIDINKARQITIKNCEVLYSGANAINILNSSNILLENNTIDYSNNIALNIGNTSNTIISKNYIRKTGAFAGMGKGDAGSYEAIMISGDNNSIKQNEIDSTGYIPITFNGNNVVVSNNFINHFAFVKDDGGGIYTYNGSSGETSSNRKIIGNIILNGIGAGDGTTNPTSMQVNGIYMDDKVNNVEVTDNTVAFCGRYGLFLHNAKDIKVSGNTLYNNGIQAGLVHDKSAPGNPLKNIRFRDNILFSKNTGSVLADYKTIGNDMKYFGSFDMNYYCRPFDDNLVIYTSFVKDNMYNNKTVNLDGWKDMYGKDRSSKQSPVSLKSYKIDQLIGNNKYQNGSFAVNTSGLYAWSAAGNSKVSWNNGSLDGGTLQISFSSLTGKQAKASVIIAIGAVTAKKAYVLRFSMKGTAENKSIEAFLRRSLSDYKDLSARGNMRIKNGRSENELIFYASTTEANASIVLNVEEQSTPLYLDNIKLHEAAITAVNPDNLIRFEYNPTGNPQTISLDEKYIDVANKVYLGKISLAPYHSLILMKNSQAIADPATVPQPPAAVACQATGIINCEFWENVAGNNISDIPLASGASKIIPLPALEISNAGSNYGSRIRGYICAPQTGNYTFYIAADDAAELWLSPDDNAANTERIARLLSWTNFRQLDKFSSQKSAPVFLKKGSKYYIKVMHKQGGGGDHLSVAWQLPDNTMEIPISAAHLAPLSNTASSRLITFKPQHKKSF